MILLDGHISWIDIVIVVLGVIGAVISFAAHCKNRVK